MSEKYIKRFSLPIRIAHWTNAISFFVLLLTGLGLYSSTFSFISVLCGGPENAQLVHRVFAIIFLLPTPFMILFNFKGFAHWTKTAFTWRENDFKYFAAFPKELFGKEANMPKQDFFNGGQKMNSLLTITCAILLVCSGLIMWFRPVSSEGVRLAYLVHDIGVGLLVPVIIGHIYLSVGHPASRPAFMGMTKGIVPASYAEKHHGKWYDEVKNAAK